MIGENERLDMGKTWDGSKDIGNRLGAARTATTQDSRLITSQVRSFFGRLELRSGGRLPLSTKKKKQQQNAALCWRVIRCCRLSKS